MTPRGLPAGARRRDIEGGASEYRVGRRLVARVYWHATGAIEHEFHFDAEGRMHGVERECFADGSTRYLAAWAHGRQHGLQQQWDERGTLLVRQRFVRGTGLDAWFDGKRLSETREFVDGERHGFERWWRTSTMLLSEMHYAKGVEHGLGREWNDAGTLRRGFPTYWVAGTQVTRQRYELAIRTDTTLPPRRVADDRSRRRSVSPIA